MAKNLNLSSRTLTDWKRGRKEVYDRLKWSYEAEALLKELGSKSNEMSENIQEVLKGAGDS